MLRAGLILSFISMTASAATYSVAALQLPSGFTGVLASGINNSGQVAAQGMIGTSYRALILSPSGTAVIPLPSGSSSAVGTAVNNSGQVTGFVDDGVQAFIGTAAGSTLIPLPAGWSYALGYAVNDSGQVAGWGIGPAGEQAFIGTVSGSAAIPLLPGAINASASAVNASGQVTGYSSGLIGQAYIGTTSGSIPIPLLPGWASAAGAAINDSGQIAGSGFNSFTMLAFFATTAGSTAIPLPIGSVFANVSGQSVNNRGTVVGYSDAGNGRTGWIWDASNGTRLLNDLVPSGWKVSNAVSISNNGLILAVASYNGGAIQQVVLTPATPPSTPAPSTLALLLLGAAFCGIWLRFARLRKAS